MEQLLANILKTDCKKCLKDLTSHICKDRATAKRGHSHHSGSRECGHDIFPAGWCMPKYRKHCFGCPVWCIWQLCPVESISQALQVWVVLATMFTGHESLVIISFGSTSQTCILFRRCKKKLKLLLQRSWVICCMIKVTTLWFIYC